MRNNRGIKQAVKHNLGKGTFRIRSGFELLNQAQSKLSEHIQVLLDGTICDTAEVFRKMDIKNLRLVRKFCVKGDKLYRGTGANQKISQAGHNPA